MRMQAEARNLKDLTRRLFCVAKVIDRRYAAFVRATASTPVAIAWKRGAMLLRGWLQ